MLTCKCNQADHKPYQGLQTDPHGQGEGLDSPCGTMAGRLAAAHTDGQSAGAGESWRAAICHHNRQKILGSILAGKSTPACHDAGSIV